MPDSTFETPTQPAQPAKKPNKALTKILSVVIILVVCVAVIAIRGCMSKEHHAQYATGETYTITGHVVKAERTKKHTSKNRSKTVYEVVLQMDEALPNGSTTYETDDSTAYYEVHQYASDQSATLLFTISEDGYLEKAEPYNE